MIHRSRASAAARFAIVTAALLLPTVTLVPLGGLFLWQNGYLLIWAIGSAISVATVYIAQKWLFSNTNAPKAVSGAERPADGIHPSWTPLEEKAWADVRQIAVSADADTISDSQALLDLGHQTINTVANRLHPGKDDALWRFTMPEALAISERVSARLSDFIVLNIPFGDRLTVSQVVQVYKWRSVADVAERAYDIWRIVRLSNPATALTHEARERLSKAMLQWGREHVSRRLIETYVEEVGRAAIDLYGGRLRISHQQLITADRAKPSGSTSASFSAREAVVIVVMSRSEPQRKAVVALLSRMERERSDATLAFLRGEIADTIAIGQPQLIIHEFNTQAGSAAAMKAQAAQLQTADVVAAVMDDQLTQSGYDREAIALISNAARVVPPVLLPIHVVQVDPQSQTRPSEISQPPPQHALGYDGKVAPGLRLELGGDALSANVAMLAMWSSLEGLAAGVRRIHLLRRVEASKKPEGWTTQARQATTAVGRLAKSLLKRRR